MIETLEKIFRNVRLEEYQGPQTPSKKNTLFYSRNDNRIGLHLHNDHWSNKHSQIKGKLKKQRYKVDVELMQPWCHVYFVDKS